MICCINLPARAVPANPNLHAVATAGGKNGTP